MCLSKVVVPPPVAVSEVTESVKESVKESDGMDTSADAQNTDARIDDEESIEQRKRKAEVSTSLSLSTCPSYLRVPRELVC